MYCIAGFGKVKTAQEITSISNHNNRIHLTQDEKKRIDHSRSHLNQVLVNPLGVSPTKATDLNQKIKKFYKDNEVVIRKDSVLGIDLMLTTSPEFFQDENSKLGKTWHENGSVRPEYRKKIDDWAATQIAFVKKQFGENSIKYAVLHLDETTPHIHLLITPEETKVLKYKNQFGEFNKTTTSLNAKKWNPTFWRKFLVNYEKANTKFGLKKGEEGSLSENVPINTFIKKLAKAWDVAVNRNFKKAFSHFVNETKGDLAWSTQAGVERIMMEKFLPKLNPLMSSNEAIKRIVKLDRAKEYTQIRKQKMVLDEKEKTLEEERKEIEARQIVYRDAINTKIADQKLIASQAIQLSAWESKYEALEASYEVLREKYEPEINPAVIQSVKEQSLTTKNKNLL